MNRYFSSAPAAMMLVLLCMVLSAGGCSKKDDTVNPQCTPQLDTLAIICNPLAPAPGDTAQLTAQTTGKSCTSLPDFEWQVQAGTLVDATGISVRWVAPEEKGVYRVFVRSSLGSAVDTLSRYIMVRDIVPINTGIRFSMNPRFILNQLYFIGSTIPTTSQQFMGYDVYMLSGTSADLITRDVGENLVLGAQSVVFLDNSLLASVVTDGSQFYRQQPVSVMLFPYETIEIPTFVARPRAASTLRWDQNTYPDASADENMFVWQQNLVGIKDDGTADLVNVAFKIGSGATLKLTTNVDSTFQLGGWTYRYWRNVRPMFSPDQTKILYFVDSTQTFEPCLIPLAGQTPLLDDRRALMVSATHGIFYTAGVKISEKTIFEWSPVANNKVAFTDDNRNLCILDVSAENVQVLSDVGKVSEFAWAADGRIAAITGDGVSVVSQAGIPDTVFRREKSTDEIRSIGWSPNPSDPKLAFRMVRKGKSSADSFSALVICSLNDRRWYYATPRIAWGAEPVVPYTYLRVLFNVNDNSIYFPAPQPETGGGKVTIFRSY